MCRRFPALARVLLDSTGGPRPLLDPLPPAGRPLRRPRLAESATGSAVDPRQVRLAVELRERVEAGGGSGIGVQRGSDVIGQARCGPSGASSTVTSASAPTSVPRIIIGVMVNAHPPPARAIVPRTPMPFGGPVHPVLGTGPHILVRVEGDDDHAAAAPAGLDPAARNARTRHASSSHRLTARVPWASVRVRSSASKTLRPGDACSSSARSSCRATTESPHDRPTSRPGWPSKCSGGGAWHGGTVLHTAGERRTADSGDAAADGRRALDVLGHDVRGDSVASGPAAGVLRLGPPRLPPSRAPTSLPSPPRPCRTGDQRLNKHGPGGRPYQAHFWMLLPCRFASTIVTAWPSPREPHTRWWQRPDGWCRWCRTPRSALSCRCSCRSRSSDPPRNVVTARPDNSPAHAGTADREARERLRLRVVARVDLQIRPDGEVGRGYVDCSVPAALFLTPLIKGVDPLDTWTIVANDGTPDESVRNSM